jgi:hypothetical protein
MSLVTLKHFSAVGSDASGSPINCSLSPGPGDFQTDDLEHNMCEAQAVYNCGTFLELTEGQQKAINFSLTMYQDGKLTDNATGKPLDLALKQGTFAAGTTRDPGGLVWTVNVVITLTRNGVTSTLTYTNVRLKVGFGLGADSNKLTLSGTAYGTGSTLPLVVS